MGRKEDFLKQINDECLSKGEGCILRFEQTAKEIISMVMTIAMAMAMTISFIF